MSENLEGRRPIASRESGWARSSAAFLAAKGVSPNFISILSIVFSMVSLVAFYADSISKEYHVILMLTTIAGIQGRLIMNLLDGMVAVEHNKKSPVGGLYNEVPDRVSDSLILYGAGLVVANIPYAMDLAWLAILLSLATAYIRTLGASLNCGHHFLGPMAKQHRMAFITVGCLASIWFDQSFFYILIVMNIGLIITCYRRLAAIYRILQKQ